MTYPTDPRTVTTEAKFVPEIWSDEVLGTHMKNLVVAGLVRTMPFTGKKGDTIHVPKPIRGSANAKVADTDVTLNYGTALELSISIAKHYESSHLIEDIVGVQALESSRRFYTEDMGYQLAKQVDSDLIALAAGFGSGATGTYTAYEEAYIGTGAAQWDPDANGDAGNAAAITDGGVRKGIQLLDDADVPQMGRVWVVPPVVKNVFLSIDRFNSSDYSKTRGVANGQFGEVYGSAVYTSSNCASVAATDTSTDQRAALFFQTDAMILVEQMKVRVQTESKLEKLSQLMVADRIYGVSLYREENGVALIVPA